MTLYFTELMYVSEEEVTPRKKSLLMAATQAYVGEDDRWVGQAAIFGGYFYLA